MKQELLSKIENRTLTAGVVGLGLRRPAAGRGKGESRL